MQLNETALDKDYDGFFERIWQRIFICSANPLNH